MAGMFVVNDVVFSSIAIGTILVAAILIDATLIRAVVLPALMTVLGRANWWTPRLLRTREQVDATEETRVLEPVG